MKIKISRDNYELYALDFVEGALDEQTHAAFLAFLSIHPELAESINDLDITTLAAPNFNSTFDKEAIKVTLIPSDTIDDTNAERYFIHRVEGLLSLDEEKELDLFLHKNPLFERDHGLYHRTKLLANSSVVFPEVKTLKRSIPLWENVPGIAMRIAAIFTLLLGGITIWNAVQSPIYTPRSASFVYSTAPLLDDATQENRTAIAQVGSRPAVITADATKQPSAEPRTNLALTPLPVTSQPQLLAHAANNPDERTISSYEPVVSAWLEEAPSPVLASENKASRAVELNVAQFLGKQFFGLDPNRTKTTQDFIREGIIRTFDRSEAIALHTSPAQNEKSHLEFIAGNFEFKRITYK